VLRGLLRSFPEVRLFADGPDLLVIASRDPLPGAGRLALPPEVAADLARVGIEGAADLQELELGDAATARRFAGTGRLHTDDSPVLEFTAPLSLARDRSGEILELLSGAS